MYIACLFFLFLTFGFKLNLIAASVFFFVNFDFVSSSIVSFISAVFVTGHRLGGFNAFLGPSTKIC